MPIYAYKCASCGYARDVLQKVSDTPLTVCPQCGKPAFQKQVTAASFQLKGTGWYATDFRNEGGGSAEPAASAEGNDKAGAKPEPAKTETKSDQPQAKGQSKSTSESASTSAPVPAAPSTPATPSAPGHSSGNSSGD
ncbi:MAG: zinc ribbon domain-containing protein [Burkholderiaceae bacterium]|nr:zinc ribbon domain-containing protein [Burkholderiaceae bacterium]